MAGGAFRVGEAGARQRPLAPSLHHAGQHAPRASERGEAMLADLAVDLARGARWAEEEKCGDPSDGKCDHSTSPSS